MKARAETRTHLGVQLPFDDDEEDSSPELEALETDPFRLFLEEETVEEVSFVLAAEQERKKQMRNLWPTGCIKF